MTSNGSGKYNNASVRQSQKGTTYFVGRLGGAKVALLKSRGTAEDGVEIWDILVSEAQSSWAGYRSIVVSSQYARTRARIMGSLSSRQVLPGARL